MKNERRWDRLPHCALRQIKTVPNKTFPRQQCSCQLSSCKQREHDPLVASFFDYQEWWRCTTKKTPAKLVWLVVVPELAAAAIFETSFIDIYVKRTSANARFSKPSKTISGASVNEMQHVFILTLNFGHWQAGNRKPNTNSLRALIGN